MLQNHKISASNWHLTQAARSIWHCGWQPLFLLSPFRRDFARAVIPSLMITELPIVPAIRSLLDSLLPEDNDAAWYRAPAIPAKKLKNAIDKYAAEVSEDRVLALGDGTVFGSAREGILITDDALFSNTTDGTFSIPFQSIAGAKKMGGWPSYEVEVKCLDGTAHSISMSCFEKNQANLVSFLNAVAAESGASQPATWETTQLEDLVISTIEPEESFQLELPCQADFTDHSITAVNAALKQMHICQGESIEDADALFDTSLRSDAEIPLLRGYCRYVGFNGRGVDGVFLLSNQRLLLFSMESGVKIVLVELTKRLLGKLPVPYVDSIVGFFVFTIPREIYVALCGGKEKMIAQTLEIEADQMLTKQPPLRKVHDYRLADFRENVAQVDIGPDVWTGILDREFGVSFSPSQLTRSLRVPKDLILPEYETLEPLERLLFSIRSMLQKIGLDYKVDAKRHTLSIYPTAAVVKAAA